MLRQLAPPQTPTGCRARITLPVSSRVLRELDVPAGRGRVYFVAHPGGRRGHARAAAMAAVGLMVTVVFGCDATICRKPCPSAAITSFSYALTAM